MAASRSAPPGFDDLLVLRHLLTRSGFCLSAISRQGSDFDVAAARSGMPAVAERAAGDTGGAGGGDDDLFSELALLKGRQEAVAARLAAVARRPGRRAGPGVSRRMAQELESALDAAEAACSRIEDRENRRPVDRQQWQPRTTQQEQQENHRVGGSSSSLLQTAANVKDRPSSRGSLPKGKDARRERGFHWASAWPHARARAGCGNFEEEEEEEDVDDDMNYTRENETWRRENGTSTTPAASPDPPTAGEVSRILRDLEIAVGCGGGVGGGSSSSSSSSNSDDPPSNGSGRNTRTAARNEEADADAGGYENIDGDDDVDADVRAQARRWAERVARRFTGEKAT